MDGGGGGAWGEGKQVRTRVGEVEAEGRVEAPGPGAASPQSSTLRPSQSTEPTFAPLAQDVGAPVDLKSMGSCVAV